MGATIAATEEAARARRAALKELLGADQASSLLAAEAAAVRRLQRRYRVQWAQELDEQAPLPAGLPPHAH
jgi:hypothetical protein